MKIFSYFINKIIQYINIILGLPFLIMFYFQINIGYYYFDKSNDDSIRKSYADKAMYYFYKGLDFSLSRNIIYLKNIKIDLEQITIINSNHYHQKDILVLFHLFNKNKILGHNISSISTSHEMIGFDFKVLRLEKAILVNNTKDDLRSINNELHYFEKRKYNTAFITFFEGIAMVDVKNKLNNLKNLVEPKSLGFQACLNVIKSKYLYDINIVYSHENKILDSKDKNFTLLLFHPKTKIYVDINKYDISKIKDSQKWIEELYQIKDKQIQKIINFFGLSVNFQN